MLNLTDRDGLHLGVKHCERERADEDGQKDVDNDSGIRLALGDEDTAKDEGQGVSGIDDKDCRRGESTESVQRAAIVSRSV